MSVLEEERITEAPEGQKSEEIPTDKTTEITSEEIKDTEPKSLKEYFQKEYIKKYLATKRENIERIKTKQGNAVKLGTEQSLATLAHIENEKFTNIDVYVLRSLLGGDRSATMQKKSKN